MSSSWAARTNLSRVAIGVLIFDPGAELNSIQSRSEPKFNLNISQLPIEGLVTGKLAPWLLAWRAQHRGLQNRAYEMIHPAKATVGNGEWRRWEWRATADEEGHYAFAVPL
jgi:hypothetical protein